MASDTISASWHPALMPNSLADILAAPSHTELAQEPQPAEYNHDFTAEPAHVPKSQETPSHDIPQDTSAANAADHGAFLDQFEDDVGAEEAGWSLSDPTTHDTSASHHEPTPVGEAGTIDHSASPIPDPVASTKAAKHSSTISFARTALDMNWNDDDDTDFNLQRTETDPFKFMPPNERTNSFPVVPPVQSLADEPLAVPPPATQAEDIMHELEQEQQEGTSAQPDFLKSFDEGELDESEQHGASFFDQPLGGDIVGTDEAVSDARFEEGLPLITPRDTEEPGVAAEASGFDEGFGDEAGEDDFFSHVPSGSDHDASVPHMSHNLQRKNTSMFVDTNPSMARVDSYNIDTPIIPEVDDPEPAVTATNDDRGTSKHTSLPGASTSEGKEVEPENLDAKWANAFASDDDEDFLLEDSENRELDPAAVFGSDDEGFLEDDDEPPSIPATTQPAPGVPTRTQDTRINGRYTPATQPTQTQPILNTFNSMPAVPQTQAFPPQYSATGTAPPNRQLYGTAARPEALKAQSFVDKAKGGYSSPYDLPMDVVTSPRKRASMQQLPRANAVPPTAPSGPPRTASMYNQPTSTASGSLYNQLPSGPTGAGTLSSNLTPPSSSHSNSKGPISKPPPPLTSKSSFFEDLPMTSKPRPASRQNSLPSPPHPPYSQHPQAPPPGVPQGQPTAPPPVQHPMAPPPMRASSAGSVGLVAPERESPYAQLQSATQQSSNAPPSNRYSPAPPAGIPNGVAQSGPTTTRYSPAPQSRSSSSGYSAVPAPILAHQPRTSSPLAHFEVSHDPAQQKLPSPNTSQGFPAARNASFQHEPRFTRVPSLPSTKEVEEEALSVSAPPPPQVSRPPVQSAESRYGPLQTRGTPPPVGPPMTSTLSPPKRPASNYAPVPHATTTSSDTNFAPPPRSQTQSPGTLNGRGAASQATESAPRPSSAHAPTSPRLSSATQTVRPTGPRVRGMSQALNMIPPTDGRELDPLERWKGAPLISWGGSGTMVTSFPKDVPRYGMNQALPSIIRSPGEVKVKQVKAVQLIEERLTKFPGPLKGKSKKKETIAWLSQGIETLEGALPNASFHHHPTHEDKRAAERVLLWKTLRILIENDGVLEGNANVEKAVRQVLSPEIESSHDNLASPVMASDFQLASGVTNLQADAVDSSALEQIRKHLLLGDREKAVWAAVDRRLWGHAMLISNTVEGDLYKQVTQEFVKKEVNQSGGSNESLAALYGVLSGNLEESVDALVPAYARAGMQLMVTSPTPGQSADALAGLDKWRETLGLILSNRSTSDIVAITALGTLLSGYGRAEAAHICFMFSRKHSVFGGLDDPNANFVLVGADHRRQANQFAKETEAVLLSEVYEYGLALSGSNALQSCPHLAAYKLQHALTLAENGSRDKALQYCEAISNAITAQTRRSPYYHSTLASAVDDLMGRLKLSPKEGSSSWIPKPTVDKVSSTMWDKFNKFVSGEENQSSGQGSPGDPGMESGPFGRLAGGTPTISRSPSVNNFEPYGLADPSPIIPATKAGSRYAPTSGQSTATYDNNSTYASRPSMERSSGEYHRSSHEMPRPTVEATPVYGSSVESNSVPNFGYQAVQPSTHQAQQYAPSTPAATAYTASPPQHSSSYSPYQPSSSHNSLLNNVTSEPKSDMAVEKTPANSGHQPISYGYEPPAAESLEVKPHDAQTGTGDAPEAQADMTATNGGWEPPSYQPYSYEPPTSYEPDAEGGDGGSEDPKPKKKSFMDDDDDFVSMKPTAQDKSKADKDRENQELFRKAAEEDAKRAEAAKAQKKGWLSGWFGGDKNKEAEMPSNKAIRAKLGETSSFVYDPDQKRWVNKKPGADNTPAKTATPPPPRAASVNGMSPPPSRGSSTPPPPTAPPMGMPRSVSNLNKMASMDNLRPPGPAIGGTPAMMRSSSNMSTVSNASNISSDSVPPVIVGSLGSGPPSRPTTSLSNASSIDDLLGAAGPRKAGGKKARKSGRYVDVMAK